MDDLRRYQLGEVRKAALDLRERQRKGLDPLELALAMQLFRFRDSRGVYWYLDVLRDQWHVHHQGGWLRSQSGPLDFEGPASLIVKMPPMPTVEADEETRRGEPAQTPNAPDALQDAIKMIKTAHDQGYLSSGDADSLLGRYYVLDDQGRGWTVGVLSGQWHSFQDGEWNVSQQPPPLESILRLQFGPLVCQSCGSVVEQGNECPRCGGEVELPLGDAAEEAYASLAGFLLLGAGTAPEPITQPWDPPGDYPSVMEAFGTRCVSVRMLNVPGVRFCSWCGAAMPAAVAEKKTVPTTVAHGEQTPPPGLAPTDAALVRRNWQLAIRQGAAAGSVHSLADRAILGRAAECEIHLQDDRVSRRHALVERVRSGYQVTDLGSSNGTFVNSRRIQEPTALRSGDTIGVGEHQLTLELESVAPPEERRRA